MKCFGFVIFFMLSLFGNLLASRSYGQQRLDFYLNDSGGFVRDRYDGGTSKKANGLYHVSCNRKRRNLKEVDVALNFKDSMVVFLNDSLLYKKIKYHTLLYHPFTAYIPFEVNTKRKNYLYILAIGSKHFIKIKIKKGFCYIRVYVTNDSDNQLNWVVNYTNNMSSE